MTKPSPRVDRSGCYVPTPDRETYLSVTMNGKTIEGFLHGDYMIGHWTFGSNDVGGRAGLSAGIGGEHGAGVRIHFSENDLLRLAYAGLEAMSRRHTLDSGDETIDAEYPSQGRRRTVRQSATLSSGSRGNGKVAFEVETSKGRVTVWVPRREVLHAALHALDLMLHDYSFDPSKDKGLGTMCEKL